MNSITIAGRLTKDAQTKRVGSDSVTSFSVVHDVRGKGGEKHPLFFDCSLWGKRGEALAGYLAKGTPVTVVGALDTREYEGKTYMQVRVNEIALQSGKREAGVGGGGTQRPAPSPTGNDEFSSPNGDDEIPFLTVESRWWRP